jgi:hypothetical protein
VRLTVVQRGREKVPGTEGRLWIEVDDVTAGQVLVKIVDRTTREDALPQRSMRFGDEAWFPLGGGTRARLRHRRRTEGKGGWQRSGRRRKRSVGEGRTWRQMTRACWCGVSWGRSKSGRTWSSCTHSRWGTVAWV